MSGNISAPDDMASEKKLPPWLKHPKFKTSPLCKSIKNSGKLALRFVGLPIEGLALKVDDLSPGLVFLWRWFSLWR
jgi:hypothetical protein